MDNTDNRSLHRSKDGSHTLYSSRFRQYYHNPNGAIAESRHVFFDTPGWLESAPPGEPFHLFEMGFGTGLNLLVLLESLGRMPRPPQIVYHAVEAYPLTPRQAATLNYQELLDLPDHPEPEGNSELFDSPERTRPESPERSDTPELPANLFNDLQPGKNERRITPSLTLDLYVGRFDHYPGPSEPLGMIFFDAFSPDVNPELWTEEVFRKLAGWSAPVALLATYGAASSARAAMAAGGWHIARAKGALGKREMTIASMDPDRLSPWKRVNEKRLVERLRKGAFE